MKKIYKIYDASERLRAGKVYICRGGEWTWEEGVTAPTQSELDAEVLRLQEIEQPNTLAWSIS